MIRVLIADDNHMAMEYFTGLIDWKENGFDIISTCVDGSQAWKVFQKHKPELVITDIEMPIMDGIELAGRIKKSSPDTVIVFLSSYKEFAYVRSALNLGVFDYILKHETNKKQLLQKINKVKKFLSGKKTLNAYKYESQLLALHEDIKELGDAETDKLDEDFPVSCDLLLVEQDHILPEMVQVLNNQTQEIKEKAVKKVCYETAQQVLAVLRINPYQFLVLLESNMDVLEAAYSIKYALHSAFDESFSILIVYEEAPASKCVRQFLEGTGNYAQRYFYADSIVLQNNFATQNTKKREFSVDYELLNKLLQDGRLEEFSQKTDHYFSICATSQSYSLFSTLAEFCISILLEYHEKILNMETGEIFSLFSNTDSMEPREGMNAITGIEWIKRQFKSLLRVLENNQSTQYSQEVKQSIAYINSHYMESELSAEKIAEQIHLNVNSLNLFFKQEMNDTVWKILIKIRMFKAKQLLDTGKYTITDICSMVGYKTISYFSRAFKKMYGIPPQEYRREVNVQVQ